MEIGYGSASETNGLIVDRSLQPKNNSVVVAAMDGDLVITLRLMRGGKLALVSDNPHCAQRTLKEGERLDIWGVVTRVLHPLRWIGCVERQHPILSIASFREAFTKADKVTLSKFEFDAIMEGVEPALSAKSDLAMARRQIERTRKVAAPVWKACVRVSKSMARYRGHATEDKIRE